MRNSLSRRKTCCALAMLLFGLITRGLGAMIQDEPAKAGSGLVTSAEVQPVGLADWPGLARALKTWASTAGRIVSFRELWDLPAEDFTHSLAISGVVVRRFKRAAVGQFPALEELWIRTDDDGLVLVTNRSVADHEERTAPGSALWIEAVFIRKVLYEAGDEPRVAPWLVAQSVQARSVDGLNSGSGGGNLPAGTGSGQELPLLIFAILFSSVVLRLFLGLASRSGRRAGG